VPDFGVILHPATDNIMSLQHYKKPTPQTPPKSFAFRSWRIGAAVLCVVGIGFLSGCASAGHTFNYAAASNLELGQLALSDYRSVGNERPSATSHHINADGTYDILRFNYGQADLASINTRALMLEFKDEKLNAYLHVSNFKGEMISIPMDKIGQIKKGESTKTDVLNLLGKPTGKALCPTTLSDFKERCNGNSEIWTWQSLGSLSSWSRSLQAPVTTVFVTFDNAGVVKEIESAITPLSQL
jgi:hypothetical protein